MHCQQTSLSQLDTEIYTRESELEVERTDDPLPLPFKVSEKLKVNVASYKFWCDGLSSTFMLMLKFFCLYSLKMHITIHVPVHKQWGTRWVVICNYLQCSSLQLYQTCQFTSKRRDETVYSILSIVATLCISVLTSFFKSYFSAEYIF